MDRTLKERLLELCRVKIEARIRRIEAGIKDLTDALKLETKCSMGDKYETGRAMLHLEFEKLSAQLDEAAKLKKTLGLISVDKKHRVVEFGSLVRTTASTYFICVPVGEIDIEGEKFYAVGANAPIAVILRNRKKGESVNFNSRRIAVEEIL